MNTHQDYFQTHLQHPRRLLYLRWVQREVRYNYRQRKYLLARLRRRCCDGIQTVGGLQRNAAEIRVDGYCLGRSPEHGLQTRCKPSTHTTIRIDTGLTCNKIYLKIDKA